MEKLLKSCISTKVPRVRVSRILDRDMRRTRSTYSAQMTTSSSNASNGNRTAVQLTGRDIREIQNQLARNERVIAQYADERKVSDKKNSQNLRRANTDISPVRKFELPDSVIELRTRRNDNLRMSKSFDLMHENDLLTLNENATVNETTLTVNRNSKHSSLLQSELKATE